MQFVRSLISCIWPDELLRRCLSKEKKLKNYVRKKRKDKKKHLALVLSVFHVMVSYGRLPDA